ncbi:MAG: hypothetical protein GF341_07490 [candidate division Zixibacteria bacterium]|nr:hypothetical protein [candidate division Zixibacteria bacterium]
MNLSSTLDHRRIVPRSALTGALVLLAAVYVCGVACPCGAKSPSDNSVRKLDEPATLSVSVLHDGPQHFADLMPAQLDLKAVPVLDNGGAMYAQVFDEFAFEDEEDKVNVTKAAVYSLLLPGAGQWYAGDKNRAGVFLAGEGVMWAAFAYFKTVQTAKQDDYEAYALANAGINPEGKDDDFYRILSFYNSREEYNSAGRIIDPSRPYYPNNEYWDWRWRSAADLEQYRDLRNQRAEARNRSRFALGALVVNRLLSAFDAWQVAKSVNRQARMEVTGWKVDVKGKPFGSDPKVMVTFKRKF